MITTIPLSLFVIAALGAAGVMTAIMSSAATANAEQILYQSLPKRMDLIRQVVRPLILQENVQQVQAIMEIILVLRPRTLTGQAAV
jgi:hypothetical protein